MWQGSLGYGHRHHGLDAVPDGLVATTWDDVASANDGPLTYYANTVCPTNLGCRLHTCAHGCLIMCGPRYIVADMSGDINIDCI